MLRFNSLEDITLFIVGVGYTVAQLVEALRYKPEGRGFDSRCGHWDISLTEFYLSHQQK
jgi:hypothetical protein